MGRPKWDNVSKSVYILSGPWTYHCQVHQKAHWLSSLIISLCISFTFSSPSLLSLSSPSSLSRAQKRERKKKKIFKNEKETQVTTRSSSSQNHAWKHEGHKHYMQAIKYGDVWEL
ncbi:hypothetical protein ACOSQ2_007226 [Xanthoceras sorbifolium]